MCLNFSHVSQQLVQCYSLLNGSFSQIDCNYSVLSGEKPMAFLYRSEDVNEKWQRNKEINEMLL